MPDDNKDKANAPANKDNTAVIVAVISLIGVIITAVVAPILNKWIDATFNKTPTPIVQPTPTFNPPTPIPSVTFTPAPPTNTAAPTDTPIPTETFTATPTMTSTATPLPGVDFSNQCLYSGNWGIVASDNSAKDVKLDSQKCYNLATFPTDWGISWIGDELSIYPPIWLKGPTLRGFTTRLEGNATIQITVGPTQLDKSEIWVGIADLGESPDINGIYLIIQHSGNNYDFSIKAFDAGYPVTQTIAQTNNRKPPYALTLVLQGNRLKINAVDGEGYAFNITLPDVQVNVLAPRRFFFGLRLFSSADVDIRFKNITITPK